jgi:uncharacterized membrane protein
MADLFVIAYEDEFKAEEVRLTLAKLQQEHLREHLTFVTPKSGFYVKLF